MKFLGIYREPTYSPGRHASNDATILRLVGQALEKYGITAHLAIFEEATDIWHDYDLIFSMCQGPQATEKLLDWQKKGALIFNDPSASQRTYRRYLCSPELQRELGFPKSVFLKTDGTEEIERYMRMFNNGAWVKRVDVHATEAGDVVRVNSPAELETTLTSFARRGFSRVVLQEHIEGDEVKFYAVEGGRLFWPYYPGEPAGYPFEQRDLEAVASKAAAVLEIGIYGGDAIIRPDGSITLIDLNDWPSFAPCRGAAASAIAIYLKDCYYACQRLQRNALFR